MNTTDSRNHTERRSARGTGAYLLASLAMLALLACSTKNKYIGVGKGDPNAVTDASIDGSAADGGGASRDGSVSATQDGSMTTGPGSDGGSDSDGGMDALDPTKSCNVMMAADDAYVATVPFANETGFALAIGETGFGVAYRTSKMMCAGSLRTMQIQATGAFPTPKVLFDDCNTMQDVALTYSSAGWRLGWVDNFTSSYELQNVALTSDLDVAAGAARATLTDNVDLEESRPVMATILDTPVVTWISRDVNTKAQAILSKRLDATSPTLSVLASSTTQTITALAVAQLGDSTGAIAWVDQGDKPGVWLQPLDKTAKPVGMPAQLTDFVSVGSNVDLATREIDGGAVLYSVIVQGLNHEVRFRRLNKAGAFMGDDFKVVGAPLQASDASFARLGGGYVVAYRALPGGIVSKPEIRVTFITKEGTTTRDSAGRLVSYHVADASTMGGRTTVRVSVDGQILVGYVDGNTAGTTSLHLVRKRLDCAL